MVHTAVNVAVVAQALLPVHLLSLATLLRIRVTPAHVVLPVPTNIRVYVYRISMDKHKAYVKDLRQQRFRRSPLLVRVTVVKQVPTVYHSLISLTPQHCNAPQLHVLKHVKLHILYYALLHHSWVEVMGYVRLQRAGIRVVSVIAAVSMVVSTTMYPLVQVARHALHYVNNKRSASTPTQEHIRAQQQLPNSPLSLGVYLYSYYHRSYLIYFSNEIL